MEQRARSRVHDFPTGGDGNEPLSNYQRQVANDRFSAQALESPKLSGGAFARGAANYARVGVIHFAFF
jgi:hypothetical protein